MTMDETRLFEAIENSRVLQGKLSLFDSLVRNVREVLPTYKVSCV